MAKKSERIVEVKATSPTTASVQRVLKGDPSASLPPIRSNCDPHFTKGATYLLFITPRNTYYPDGSAVRLMGFRGKRWANVILQWIKPHTKEQENTLLYTFLLEELLDPPTHSGWRMLRDFDFRRKTVGLPTGKHHLAPRLISQMQRDAMLHHSPKGTQN